MCLEQAVDSVTGKTVSEWEQLVQSLREPNATWDWSTLEVREVQCKQGQLCVGQGVFAVEPPKEVGVNKRALLWAVYLWIEDDGLCPNRRYRVYLFTHIIPLYIYGIYGCISAFSSKYVYLSFSLFFPCLIYRV